uniref:Uncharacterized protein n=1 Tax=Arundo donax TaxID=35708 RepID=A0A0A9I616_ARUDO
MVVTINWKIYVIQMKYSASWKIHVYLLLLTCQLRFAPTLLFVWCFIRLLEPSYAFSHTFFGHYISFSIVHLRFTR